MVAKSPKATRYIEVLQAMSLPPSPAPTATGWSDSCRAGFAPAVGQRRQGAQENAFKGPLIDLDLHHPPCRKFRANQAFYICGQLAQMLLRAVQYQLLPARARRHGLRPLIRYLVRAVGRLVRSGRRWRLDFARNNFRLDWLYHAAVQLE